MAELDFLVQRFNAACSEDQGSRSSYEDSIIIKQEIGISYKLNVSFFAVLDGHGGIECVNYVASNLLENFRSFLLKSTIAFDD